MTLEQILTTIVVGVIILLILFASSYVKVRPNEAYIITGPKKSRVVIGKGTIRIPFLERIDTIPLSLIQTDIRTESAVPTNEFINIFVDGVANIRIKTDEDSIRLAGQILLSRDLEGIRIVTKEVLEGNMREIIGQMKLKELVQNRDKFAEQVYASAMQDMARMGLEIVNITIQNFSDKNGVIEDLGVDNVTQIRKDAAIARANSEKEVSIASANAKELSNEARIQAELKIAEQNTDLAIRQAALKQKADALQATADLSYEIQKANETKSVNIAIQEAEIAKRTKEIELKAKEVEVEERRLEAMVKKNAEANRYAAEQQAQADLFVRSKEAEAKLIEEQRQAEAIKARAEAQRFADEQRALGIQAVGLAEAEAIEKKAEAMKKMEDAAVLELILNSDVLPKIVAAAAEPLAKVDKITMYGDGNSTKLVGDIVNSSTQILSAVKEGTGIDLTSLLAGYATGKMVTKKEEEK
ncbi:flotillin family protein [Acholeplasma hippikon]|uniref:Inner membrane protein yqiK n=1 Tax=Acholeplasma hippikon TaxID=264636 RepID=A0A449BLE3_9MOLU|nr:flotillin family protein [Acholeplasma hippikon]VEU83255.1 Inner membrane protein yqiK [Acholeplasma hippikon]